ncbi:hypothetical protein [Alistipes sp.]|uniref:hypothetical protein n=1 Tax=Alistipes sp. TaxID=1872444 RepID=UPI003AF1B210
MKVKIKGIREPQEATYVFKAGELVGVMLAEDAENGVANVFPMELVEDICDE